MASQGVTPTPLLGIDEWDGDILVEVARQGPFLNDAGKIYKVRGGTEAKGTLKGNVPAGEDVNQVALVTALTGGTDINLVLRQGITGASTTGFVLTVPTAIISNIKVAQNSKSGASFTANWESNGGYTLV